MFSGFGGWNGFSIMSAIFPIAFLLILALFVAAIVRGLMEWNRNNHSPRLTVFAAVAGKRAEVSHSHHSHAGGTSHMSTSTWYYVTFEVEGGDRMELAVSGHEYGMLAEGDRGRLTFQGTRYLSFERETEYRDE